MLAHLPAQDILATSLGQDGDRLGFKWICAASRTVGARLGYIFIPRSHKWASMDVHDIPVTVHGGLTSMEPDTDPAAGVWIGFDCAHAGDAWPDPEIASKQLLETFEGVRPPDNIANVGDGVTIKSTAFVAMQASNVIAQAWSGDPWFSLSRRLGGYLGKSIKMFKRRATIAIRLRQQIALRNYV